MERSDLVLLEVKEELRADLAAPDMVEIYCNSFGHASSSLEGLE
jgi:hypothetical protein